MVNRDFLTFIFIVFIGMLVAMVINSELFGIILMLYIIATILIGIFFLLGETVCDEKWIKKQRKHL